MPLIGRVRRAHGIPCGRPAFGGTCLVCRTRGGFQVLIVVKDNVRRNLTGSKALVQTLMDMEMTQVIAAHWPPSHRPLTTPTPAGRRPPTAER